MGEEVFKADNLHLCYILLAKVFDLRIFPIRCTEYVYFLHFLLLVVALVLRFGDRLEEIFLYLHSLVTPRQQGREWQRNL